MKFSVRLFALFFLVSAVVVTIGAQQKTDPKTEAVKKQLIGSYKLISYTSFDQNGVATKLPYIAGQISYDAANRMSAQLMRDPQAPPTATQQQSQAAAATSQQTQVQGQGQGQGRGQGQGQGQGRGGNNGFISYFGDYTIDAAKSIVYHHFEASISQKLLGQAMPRYFEFSPEGNSLFLHSKNGDRVTGRLQWDRY